LQDLPDSASWSLAASAPVLRDDRARDAAPALAATTTGDKHMLHHLRLFALVALALAAELRGADDFHRGRNPAPPKVILDTDFNTISDDGQALAMLAQLDAAGKLDLLGVTVATGNAWLEQETSDALKAVERLGIERSVGVYVGAKYPLLHDYDSYLDEVATLGAPIDYVGAFASPPPTSRSDLVPPPDGFATHTRPQAQHAVDFLIEQIHRYPHQVSILEIAPPTNLAMAIRKDPGIVPLIKQVVTMAGQIYVAGNAYNDVAEFNWWADPEAVKIVLRAAVPKVILPLDLTNNVPLTKAGVRADREPPAGHAHHQAVHRCVRVVLRLRPGAVSAVHLGHHRARLPGRSDLRDRVARPVGRHEHDVRRQLRQVHRLREQPDAVDPAAAALEGRVRVRHRALLCVLRRPADPAGAGARRRPLTRIAAPSPTRAAGLAGPRDRLQCAMASRDWPVACASCGCTHCLTSSATAAMTPGIATIAKMSAKPNWRRVSSATRNEPAMPPKRPNPSIHDTPVARPAVG
jgi:inosine-uridine nucleoside N-ribohydrolase